MDKVTLSLVSDDGRRAERHLEPERRDQTVDDVDRGVGAAVLDLVDARRADADRCP
jgi:hypothetical protein